VTAKPLQTGEDNREGSLPRFPVTFPSPVFRSYADGSSGVYSLGLHSTLRYVDTPLTPSTAKAGSAPLIPPEYDHQPDAATKGTQERLPPQFSSGTLFPHQGTRLRRWCVLSAPVGAKVEDVSRQIAMRIDNADTVASFDVLENQVAEQCRFASAGFSNHIEVMRPVFGKKNKGHFLPPLFMNSQDDVLHIPNGPLLRGDNSPNTPPALVGGGCIVGDMRFLRAAKVIEARLKTSLTHSCATIISVHGNPQNLWITF
jgi:hypothetical protein